MRLRLFFALLFLFLIFTSPVETKDNSSKYLEEMRMIINYYSNGDMDKLEAFIPETKLNIELKESLIEKYQAQKEFTENIEKNSPFFITVADMYSKNKLEDKNLKLKKFQELYKEFYQNASNLELRESMSPAEFLEAKNSLKELEAFSSDFLKSLESFQKSQKAFTDYILSEMYLSQLLFAPESEKPELKITKEEYDKKTKVFIEKSTEYDNEVQIIQKKAIDFVKKAQEIHSARMDQFNNLVNSLNQQGS